MFVDIRDDMSCSLCTTWSRQEPDISGVIFNPKMTLEKHLYSVSKAAFQMFGILKKSWRLFTDRLLLERCFRGFVLPVLEHCSAVWCSAADTHLKLLERVFSGANFWTVCVFECNIAQRRTVAVLYYMLYKIRCNSMYIIFGGRLYPMCQR